ncbi:uncharacterized protein [Apostichopus japonicus]|uniref:uncharacterized protein n=1 Tax=Stichopus japonicus TaxID=307972 RepID=UPI003AB5B8E2
MTTLERTGLVEELVYCAKNHWKQRKSLQTRANHLSLLNGESQDRILRSGSSSFIALLTRQNIRPQLTVLWRNLQITWSLLLHKEPVVITGDFNIHVDDVSDMHARKFNDLISSFGLEQHVKDHTHSAGHVLDLLITRECDNLVLSTPDVAHFISDHAFVHSDLAFLKLRLDRKSISFRKYKAIDIAMFKRDIQASPLFTITSDMTVTSPTDLDRIVALYNTTLRELIDKHAPVKTKVITIRPVVPWMNDEIKQGKCARRKAERCWRKCPVYDPVDREFRKQQFQHHRNSVRAQLIRAKTEHYSQKVIDCSSDSKRLIELMNSLLKPNCDIQYPPTISLDELSNDFGDYFMSKIDKIRDELDNDDVPDICRQNIAHSATPSFHSFSVLSEEDVRALLRQSPSKHCVNDPIPTWLLKECAEVILPFLTMVINMSLQHGYFPPVWQNAVVTPILKKPGAENVFSNYRPVSNLPFLSKLVERAVVGQLQLHLSNNNLLPPNQSAYRQFHSTETSLLKVQSDMRLEFDRQKVVLLVMLDLSSAFDTIDHGILLKTIESHLGVFSTALCWFKSYLERHTQQVMVNNKLSKSYQLRFGVPQGSCLGPVLFTVYAAPVLEIIERHLPSAQGYADDHQLYIGFKPDSRAQEKFAVTALQECISDVRHWMLTNKLKINDSKTEFIILGGRQQLEKVTISDITVGDAQITPCSKVRNLGVIFDEKLSMDQHVSKVCSVAYYHLHNIARIRDYLTHEAACSLIHAFITSQIDYCNSLMYGVPAYLINKLQRVQNSAARLVLGLKKSDHITPALIDLHWLPVQLRIHFKVLLIVFKILHDMAPEYLGESIELRHNSTYRLRSNDAFMLSTPSYRCTTFGGRAFHVYAPRLWNSLPLTLRSQHSLTIFKRDLKTHLFTQFLNNSS